MCCLIDYLNYLKPCLNPCFDKWLQILMRPAARRKTKRRSFPKKSAKKKPLF